MKRLTLVLLVIFIVAVLLVPTASFAWDRGHRGGHGGGYYGGGHYYHGGGHYGGNFWGGVAVGIIGGAVAGALTSPYYSPYYYTPAPVYTTSSDCRRIMVVDRYGYLVREYEECYPNPVYIRRW